MRTRSRSPPRLMRGFMRSVWLLNPTTPSAGAGAAAQVPTQCLSLGKTGLHCHARGARHWALIQRSTKGRRATGVARPQHRFDLVDQAVELAGVLAGDLVGD